MKIQYALIFSLFIVFRALAQDSHYWYDQYGTRANLLGGCTVGSVRDLSATYYNPGSLAMNDEPALLLTSDAIEL
jgi:hypothetical protein